MKHLQKIQATTKQPPKSDLWLNQKEQSLKEFREGGWKEVGSNSDEKIDELLNKVLDAKFYYHFIPNDDESTERNSRPEYYLQYKAGPRLHELEMPWEMAGLEVPDFRVSASDIEYNAIELDSQTHELIITSYKIPVYMYVNGKRLGALNYFDDDPSKLDLPSKYLMTKEEVINLIKENFK